MFATQDQTALTIYIARLQVGHIIAHHGVTIYIPSELISDHGPAIIAFLSKPMSELCKVNDNTTVYHPQTDGLSERALTDMLS